MKKFIISVSIGVTAGVGCALLMKKVVARYGRDPYGNRKVRIDPYGNSSPT